MSIKENEIQQLIVNCEHCEKEINKFVNDYHDVDGDIYCDDCFKDLYVICEHCGDAVTEDDSYTDDSGNYYCDECYHDLFTHCERCNDLISVDDSRYTEITGFSYCSDCYDDLFTTCDHCHNEIRQSDRYYHNHNDYCVDCYTELFTTCYDCGDTISCDDSIHDDDSGYDYCSYCYDKLKTKIHNYNYKPTPIFYGDKVDIFLGIELEVEGDKDIVEELDHDKLYYKYDGSLNNGFEIVSHPMTYKYIKESKIFEDTLRTCRNNSCLSHDTSTCGLHFHVDKSLFSNLHLYKVLKLVHENELLFLKLAQRKQSEAERWSNFNYDNNYELIMDAKRKYKSDRYKAINLQNTNTVEFRFFKGNLRIERLYKNIEVLLSIIEFCKHTGLRQLTKYQYLKFITDNKKRYINLCNFILEKNIF